MMGELCNMAVMLYGERHVFTMMLKAETDAFAHDMEKNDGRNNTITVGDDHVFYYFTMHFALLKRERFNVHAWMEPYEKRVDDIRRSEFAGVFKARK